MAGIARRPYAVEEDVLIVELYSRIPISRIRKDDSEIIGLSDFLTCHGCPRTPSAIKFKMENLKSLDEVYLDGGRRVGMYNTSAQLSDIWHRFCEYGFADIDVEACKARKALVSGDFGIRSAGEYFVDDAGLDGKTAMRMTAVRVNQDVFRCRVMASYHSSCCVTGLDIPELLRASHIKPWRDCDGESSWQRMDVRNGLCLNALHDSAFDSGYMGIDEDMRVMYSPGIAENYDRESVSKLFLPYEGKRIDTASRIPAGEQYLDYHRKSIFVKS